VRKVIVTGGRDYADEEKVFAVLDRVNPDVVIQGECPDGGADLLAKKWCRVRGKPCIGMEAMWTALGRAAGPIRNGWMLAVNAPISGVVEFPGGRGTADMVRQARAAGITVYTAS
jgi:hypothetical protein